jgi:SSS family solute:Na+ symporter
MVFALDTAQGGFNLLLQIGGGTGLLYLLRWFWWRVNAWCEIVAMISSFGFSVLLLVLAKNGVSFSTQAALLMTVAVTTVCWLITAYVSPATDRDVLIRFYTLVRPAGPGWARVRSDAGVPADSRTSPDNIPMALLGWVAGCAAIWSALFAVGNLLYYRLVSFTICTVVFVVAGIVLIKIVQALWSGSGERATATSRA